MNFVENEYKKQQKKCMHNNQQSMFQIKYIKMSPSRLEKEVPNCVSNRVTRNVENNRKAMNRNWNNQKANPALKTKAGNK